MAALTSNSEAVGLIMRALNLPKNTVAATLRMRSGELVTLEIETVVEDDSLIALASVLNRYRLEEIGHSDGQ